MKDNNINTCEYNNRSLNYSCTEEVSNEYPDDRSKHHCIFHSVNKKKAADFYKLLWDKIKDNDEKVIKAIYDEKNLTKEEIRKNYCLNFIGYYFPELYPKYHPQDINNIESDIKFDYSKFQQFMFLNSLTFKGIISFNHSEFDSEFLLSKVFFKNKCSFSEARFLNPQTKVMLDLAEFNNDVDFTLVKFISEVSFKNSTFKGEANFNGAMFKNEANFNGAVFKKGLFLNQTVFYDNAHFSGLGVYDYSEGQIKGPTTIRGSIFFEAVDFSERLFKGPVHIENSIFCEDMKFTYSMFTSTFNLIKSLFIKTLQINNCRLDYNSTFYCNSFFYGKLLLSNSKLFQKDFRFDSPTFSGQIFLNNISLNLAKFSNCFLGSSIFLESDVDKSNFSNCFWSQEILNEQVEKQKNYFIDLLSNSEKYVAIDNRNDLEQLKKNISEIKTYWRLKRKRDIYRTIILHDEIKYCEESSNNSNLRPIQVGNLYQQFKVNRDSNKSYVEANEFYFGEKLFEMKSLWHSILYASKPIKIVSFLKWIFLGVYWLLNGFGNRPFRTLIWFATILLLNSCMLINCNALTITENNVNRLTLTESLITDQHIINSKIEDSRINIQKNNTVLSFKKDFYNITMWNLKAPLSIQYGLEPVNWRWHLYLFFIQYVFRPFMIAMVIISFRRKVHRGA